MSVGLVFEVFFLETHDPDVIFTARQLCRDLYVMANLNQVISKIRKEYGLQDPLPYEKTLHRKETAENTYYLLYRLICIDRKYRSAGNKYLRKQSHNEFDYLCKLPLTYECYQHILDTIPEFTYVHKNMCMLSLAMRNREAYSVFAQNCLTTKNSLINVGDAWFFKKTEELHPEKIHIANEDRLNILTTCLTKTSIIEYNDILDFYGLERLEVDEITNVSPTIFKYVMTFSDEDVTKYILKNKVFDYNYLDQVKDRKLDWVKISSTILTISAVVIFDKVMLYANNDIISILDNVENPVAFLRKYYNCKIDWIAVAYWFKRQGNEENYWKAMYHTGYNFNAYNSKYQS